MAVVGEHHDPAQLPSIMPPSVHCRRAARTPGRRRASSPAASGCPYGSARPAPDVAVLIEQRDDAGVLPEVDTMNCRPGMSVRNFPTLGLWAWPDPHVLQDLAAHVEHHEALVAAASITRGPAVGIAAEIAHRDASAWSLSSCRGSRAAGRCGPTASSRSRISSRPSPSMSNG